MKSRVKRRKKELQAGKYRKAFAVAVKIGRPEFYKKMVEKYGDIYQTKLGDLEEHNVDIPIRVEFRKKEITVTKTEIKIEAKS